MCGSHASIYVYVYKDKVRGKKHGIQHGPSLSEPVRG